MSIQHRWMNCLNTSFFSTSHQAADTTPVQKAKDSTSGNFSPLPHRHMHFFGDLSIPPRSQPSFPSRPLHCAGTAVCLAVGGPEVGRSSWRGGRAAYGSSGSAATERVATARDAHEALRRPEGSSEPPRCSSGRSVGSPGVSDAIVW